MSVPSLCELRDLSTSGRARVQASGGVQDERGVAMTTGNCLDAITSRLNNAGVHYEVLEHAPVASTSEAAAEHSISGYAFAKAVVLIVDNLPQLHVLRAADQVDLDSVRSIQADHEVRIARDGEFEHLFPGCELAPPPMSLTPNLPVRVDRRLMENERITFEVGDATHSIRMRTDDYLRVVNAEVADFAEVLRGKGRQRTRGGGMEWGSWARRGMITAGLVSSAAVMRRPLRRLLRQPAGRSFVAGAAGGVITSALADPRSGNRRRHLLWDRGSHLARRTGWWTSKKARYLKGRSEGVRHEAGEVLPRN